MSRALILGLFTLGVFACGKAKSSDDDREAPQTASAGATLPANSDPRAAIFLEKGCPQCHSISPLAIKSATEVGPDLGMAYTDVQTRFGVKLEEFLHNPTGTMQIVLSSQIQLSPTERDSIIHLLKELDEEREDDHD